jgi:glutamate synthase (NADPH) small chain
MDLEKLLDNERLCITEEPSACTAKCPLHVDVNGMMNEISQGNFSKAYKILIKKLPFPKVLCRICDHVCESVCVRNGLGGSISIHELEKAVIKYGASKPSRSLPIPKNNNKVAVVGGGISGLSAAVDLDKKGYSVTIYEKENKLGGRMWTFPKEVLPDDIINEEIDSILNSSIQIKFNAEIKPDDLELLCNDFDAVYVGIGRKIHETIDMDTFQTEKQKIFAGGTAVYNNDSVIFSISSGKRAANSIDRYVQKKSLTAVREREGSYDSPLKLNIDDFTSCNKVEAEGGELSEKEAIKEASRCIKCQCIECYKACTHLRKFEALPKAYIRKIKHNEEIILGDHYANKMINSCNMCGLCSEVCPSKLNMREIILNTRKSMIERNKMPLSAHDFALKDMEFSNSDRFQLCSHQKQLDKSRYLFFPGCQLSASSPEYVEKIYSYLTSSTDDGVGVLLGCCGAPAEWAGREDIFNKTINNLKEKWNAMGKPIFILACSSCCSIFEKYIPEVNFISLWEFMDEHGVPQSVNADIKRTFAIHDACTTRYNKKLQNSVRKIVESLGCEIEELRYSKEKTKCCGYGGLVFFANKEQTDQTIEERTQESSSDYLVYCTMCRDLFASHNKRTLHLLDLIFGDNLDELSQKKGPRLWERRINRSITKAALQKMLGEEMEKMKSSKYNIVLTDEIKNLMEDRWILLQDVEQVIEGAEETGEKFRNPESGKYLARKRIDNVTYWVEYDKKDDAYLIDNVYSHRMEVVEE